jgi:hypothetical protein
MGHATTQFAAFVDGTRRFRSAVTADAARKRELLEELARVFCVLALVWVDLGICSLEIGVRECRWGSVAEAGNVDHAQIVFYYQPVPGSDSQCPIRRFLRCPTLRGSRSNGLSHKYSMPN